MAIEVFANNASSVLNGDIDGSTTTVVLADGSPFPATGNFRIIVDSEIMLVTARSSNTLTVTRSVEGTAAVSHSNSTTVNHILTAGTMDAFRTDNIASGTYANLPAAAKAGRIYIPNNSFYDLLYDNGSSWDHIVRGKKVTPPVLGDFTWTNQGSATTVTTNGGIYLSTPNEADNNRFLRLAYPSAPFTRTLCCIPHVPIGTAGYPNCGIVITDGTKVISLGVGWRQDATAGPNNVRGSFFEVIRWSTVSTFNAESFVYPGSYFAPIWLRFNDNNTDRLYQVSYDGTNFTEVFSETRTNYFTPTHIGFYVNSAGGSIYTGITVLGWD